MHCTKISWREKEADMKLRASLVRVVKKKIASEASVSRYEDFWKIDLCFYNFELAAQKKYFLIYKFIQFT